MSIEREELLDLMKKADITETHPDHLRRYTCDLADLTEFVRLIEARVIKKTCDKG